MIILAVDYGARRIGLAVSDALGIAAHGLPTLERKDPDSDIAAIVKTAGERKADLILVGLPLNMDDTEGPQARQAREFAGRLASASAIPVELTDERLSSYEATEALKEMGVKASDWRRYVDQLAAKMILTRYLERTNRNA